MKDSLMQKAVLKVESIGKAVLKAVPVGERLLGLADTVTEAGKAYTLSRMYDLGGETVRLPHGVVLTFKAGAGVRNGGLVGDAAIIKADTRIFYGVELTGTWACKANALWWTDGCQISETDKGVPFVSKYVDDYRGLQSALDSTFTEIVFPPRLYYTTQTLLVWNEKRLTMEGARLGNSLNYCPMGIKNAAILFTDKNVGLLMVAAGGVTGHHSVAIVGGNLDVSMCKDYKASVIEVRTDAGERMWGLTIATNIRASFSNRTGTGININPVENKASTGYVTEIRINSCIANFAVGVRATDWHDEKTLAPYNWCSDVTVDGSIINCAVCVDGNTDMDIRAMMQAGWIFGVSDNDVPLIHYTGTRACVSSNIFDIRMGNDQGFSNEYAIEVSRSDAMVTCGGAFRAFVAQCEKLKWPVVKGHVLV